MSIAVIAGSGPLPLLLAQATGAVVVRFPQVQPPRQETKGVSAASGQPSRTISARFECLGALFADLRAEGVREVVLAGAMSRPRLDPAAFDALTAKLAPRLVEAMAGGDDALLRQVIAIFETQGFAVRGAHELLPGLTAALGPIAGPDPSPEMRRDAARGRAILAALGPVDVGQGTVVAGGLCLGLETVQGTDSMLDYVVRSRADTPAGARLPAGGVLIKRAKPGQDLRVDMPAVGPRTVAGAAAAGLSGICLQAEAVLTLDREAMCKAAEAAGLSIWAEP